MTEDASGATGGLQAGNDFQCTVVGALSANAIRVIYFKSGVRFVVTFGGDFNVDAVGIDPEGEWFHRNGSYFISLELEVSLQQKIADMSKVIRSRCAAESEDESYGNQTDHEPISHNESWLLPDGS